MAITDISISEELMTNAPSIKYRGDEGPKSPQQQNMMMAGPDGYFKIFEFMLNELEGQLGRELTDEEYEEVGRKAMDEFQQSRGPVLPNDPTEPVNPFQPNPQGPVLPNRQMAAYGGIMGLDGRRRYGFGSKLKKAFRKIIPNEIAAVAEKAAPFVAPFNPLAAGLMSGIGGFDRTGSIGSSIKSGLMNYGLGQGARFLGGGADNLQKGFGLKINPGGEGIRQYFSSPMAAKTAIGQGVSGSDKALFTSNEAMRPDLGIGSGGMEEGNFLSKIANPEKIVQEQSTSILGDLPKLVKDNLSKVGLGNNLVTGLLAGGLGASALMGNMTEEEVQDISRGDGIDVEAIRTEVLEAMKDPSGEALKAIRAKYPFLGTQRSKNLAYGGRIGKAEGGLMDLGGMEKDYRAEGGFVPIGKAEKADDVPARLSVNEFVFTADAVRNAGGGDIDKGAEVMENMMKNLEAGGQVSEESQGMAGAQQMFETSERLSEVI